MTREYPVVIEGGASGFVPDLPAIAVAGEDRDEVIRLAGEAIALRLYDLKRDGVNAPEPSQLERVECTECEEAWEVVLVTPAEVNPISLQLDDAIRSARLNKTEVARRLGVSRQSVQRLVDPFYFGHSVGSLRRIAHVLGLELRVSFVRAA